jgi:hypothetical protein
MYIIYMALRRYYNEDNGGFNMNTVERELKITNGTNYILHKYDASGNYDISHSDGTDLISFTNSKSLTTDCQLYGHIQSRVDPLNTMVSSHTSTIADHAVRITAVESATDSAVVLSGTSSDNTPFVAGNIAIASDKVGLIKGVAKSETSYIEFDIYVKNDDGTLSILSWNKNSKYVLGSENLTFSVSVANIVLTMTNRNSSSNWKVIYNTDFVNLT